MTVHLVGAGPGDPDLLTLRAATLLGRADVIVHDRLVDERILAGAAPWAELVDVGKIPGSKRNSQNHINDVLIERGRNHDTVVRLKGGDPFIFGRGGEEAQALRAAGIDVEVVPGITSSVAAPAAAGIPVTMRNQASGVTIITAHQDPNGPNDLDWDALAKTGTTLVILMGAARARSISQRLLAAGMAPDTPVATVTSATRDDQHVTRLTLDRLGLEPVRSPATIVVGTVAAHDVTATVDLHIPALAPLATGDHR